MNLTKLFIFFMPFLLLQPALLTAKEIPHNFTKDALSAEITKEGFNLLTELAKEKLLTKLENTVLADMNFDIPLLFRLKMKKISLSAVFEDMKLSPNKNGLDFEIKIKNLTLDIGKIEMRSWWFNRLTICSSTKIHLANNHTVPINGNFGLALNDGKFSVDKRSLDFKLNKNQYTGTGPSECRKPSGKKRRFTKWIMGFVIRKARKLINSLGKNMIANLAKDKIQDLLNTKLADIRVPLTVPSLYIIPETKMLLGFKIEKLNLSDEALNLTLSLGAERDNSKALNLEGNEFPDLLRFATIKVKPEFANVLFQTLIPDRTLPFEITTNLNEMISQMLTKEAWVGFIPDLDLVETDNENLKLFVSLDAPKVKINEKETGLLLETPKIFLDLKINQDGKWIDYHSLHLNLETEINISIKEKKLNLEILPVQGLAEGVWANNYKPQDPTVNQEEASEGFLDLIEMAGEIIPEIEVPAFKITGGTKMTIGSLNFEDSKISVDLIKAN